MNPHYFHHKERPWRGLFLLALVGGMVYTFLPDLLRIWGRRQGFSLTQLDAIGVTMVWGQGLQIFLGPFLARAPHGFFYTLGVRRTWFLCLFMALAMAFMMLAQTSFLSVPFQLLLGLCILLSQSYNSLSTVAQMQVTPVVGWWGLGESLYLNGFRLGVALWTNAALLAWAWGANLSQVLQAGAAVVLLYTMVLARWHGGYAFLITPQEKKERGEKETPKIFLEKGFFTSFPSPFTTASCGSFNSTPHDVPFAGWLYESRGHFVLYGTRILPGAAGAGY